MSDLNRTYPKPGEKYQHYKGGQYEVICMCNHTDTNEPLVVYGDGTQTRTFCSVSEVVNALSLLSEQDQTIGEVYNVGSANEISILDLAKKVISITNSNSKIIHKSFSEKFGEEF